MVSQCASDGSSRLPHDLGGYGQFASTAEVPQVSW